MLVSGRTKKRNLISYALGLHLHPTLLKLSLLSFLPSFSQMNMKLYASSHGERFVRTEVFRLFQNGFLLTPQTKSAFAFVVGVTEFLQKRIFLQGRCNSLWSNIWRNLYMNLDIYTHIYINIQNILCMYIHTYTHKQNSFHLI